MRIHTKNGKKLDLENLKPEDIDIQDIAHALSMQCRYNGQIKEFYSVAQHSVLVANALYTCYRHRRLAMCGLLHDAAEAYLGDIISPLKQKLVYYKEMEAKVQETIIQRFALNGFYEHNASLIDKQDKELAKAEMDYFYRDEKTIYGVLPQKQYQAKRTFMFCYTKYLL